MAVDSPKTRFRIWDLILVGQTLECLQYVTAADDSAGVLDQIGYLLELLEQLELTESDQHARDWLGSTIKGLKDQLKEDPHTLLGKDVADGLREAIADLVDLVRLEANQRSIFVVPYDRDGYAEKLLNDPAAAFCVDTAHSSPPPQHALNDLEEAAECYAIGRPAAAIVFSLRAMEAFLRQFYHEVVGDPPQEDDGWGTLMRIIQLPVVACDNHSISSLLGELKKRRNKAMHAGHREKGKWDDKAARRVMEQCGKAIKAMWSHLTDRSARAGRLDVLPMRVPRHRRDIYPPARAAHVGQG